jgi:alginate O-acetyltransferase complex protein AlgI
VIFNSVTFVAFLAIVLPLHWLVPAARRNTVLLVASYVFYGWWDWRFLGLIALSTFVDFGIGRRLAVTNGEGARKRLLAASLGFNLGVLGVFKYFDFFIDGAVDVANAVGFDTSGPMLNVLLPVGISFYTFQTISYTFDVYRRRIEPSARFLDFATYVAYFPQLVAGPIERAQRLLPRIQDQTGRTFPRAQRLDRALSLILSGLFKKVVLADGVAPFVNEVFADPERFGPVAVGAGVVGFAIQLYGDFSGYTDIARGVSELFGIDLMVNFRQPYLSRNITEFWRRWHISLSDWLRDYVYIPFGGNRGSSWFVARNLMATMLLGGLWHGASWNFVIWGALHGAALVVHRFVRAGRVPGPALLPSQLPAIVATFLVWCVSMVFFRAESIGAAMDVFAAIGRPQSGEAASASVLLVAMLLVATIWLDVVQRRAADRHDEIDSSAEEVATVPRSTGPAHSTTVGALTAGAMLVAIVVFSGGTPVPFIYFQF